MQESSLVLIGRMNGLYPALRLATGREESQSGELFMECHDQLRRQGVKFHMRPDGQWVIDEPPFWFLHEHQ